MTDNEPTVTTRTITTRTRKWDRWQNITHIELGPDGAPLTITGTREADGEWRWADEDTSNQED
jgi:hypothetical protein